MVLIKTTGVVLLADAAQSLAYPTMTCPVTGKKFTMDDVLELQSASSAFAASGNVEAKKYRLSLN